jgi:hypothetical protein
MVVTRRTCSKMIFNNSIKNVPAHNLSLNTNGARAGAAVASFSVPLPSRRHFQCSSHHGVVSLQLPSRRHCQCSCHRGVVFSAVAIAASFSVQLPSSFQCIYRGVIFSALIGAPLSVQLSSLHHFGAVQLSERNRRCCYHGAIVGPIAIMSVQLPHSKCSCHMLSAAAIAASRTGGGAKPTRSRNG